MSKDYLGNNTLVHSSVDEDSGESEPVYNYTAVKNDTNLKDSNIDRKVLPQDVQKYMRNQDNVVPWETDPVTLRDYSNNAIIQAFIDTLAKDVSAVEYNVVTDDGEQESEVMNFLKNASPDKSYRDLIEATVRDLLTYGNAFWVIHRYKDSDEPAEIVSPDPSTMFIVTDDDGYTEGYAQKQQSRKSKVINKEDVIHFNWASSNLRKYSRSPVETVMDYIDIIEELLVKERLDLVEGGVSAIISQTEDHDTQPLSSSEHSELETAFNSKKGLRHANIFTRGSFERTEIGTNYSDMDIIERYNSHIQKIASAFKIPPSYAGIDYENTNRATDENQTANYEMKGINVILQQLKSKINQELIPEFEDDDTSIKFEWSIETNRDLDKIDYYKELGEAVQELSKAGVPFDVTDNGISIPDDVELDSPEKQNKTMNVQMITDMIALLDEYDLGNIEEEISEDIEEDSKESEVGEVETLSDRQKELVENVEGVDNFVEAIKYIENSTKTRSESIQMCKECLGGSLSNSTYYSWLEQVGIKE